MGFARAARDISPRTVALVAAAVLAAGCAAAPTEEQASQQPPEATVVNRAAAEQFLADALAHRPPPAPIPDGFRLRTVTDAGVALALPARWPALRGNDARRPGTLRMFGAVSSQLGPVVAALAMPDSPLKLLAFDPRFAGGYATTASIVQAAIEDGVPYESWSARAVAHVRTLPSRRAQYAGLFDASLRSLRPA
jgi:hypothetical protein